MGVTIRKYFQFKNSRVRMQEVSTARVYPGLENSWTGYEQLVGSWCTSTKRAEIEIPGCVCGYHVYQDRWAVVVGEL